MKKSTKYLLIVLGIVIVLGAAVLVLVLTDPNRGEEEESSAVEDTSITLNEREEAELASMEVTFRDNEAGSYTLLSVEPADDSEDISFTVEGLEELSLSTSTLNSVASFGYGLTATRDLGTLENPAEYGPVSYTHLDVYKRQVGRRSG